MQRRKEKELKEQAKKFHEFLFSKTKEVSSSHDQTLFNKNIKKTNSVENKNEHINGSGTSPNDKGIQNHSLENDLKRKSNEEEKDIHIAGNQSKRHKVDVIPPITTAPDHLEKENNTQMKSNNDDLEQRLEIQNDVQRQRILSGDLLQTKVELRLANQQLKEKEQEYNELVAMMDDKFIASVDENRKLNEMLELKKEEISQLESEQEERIREIQQASDSDKKENQQEIQTLNNDILHLQQKLLQQQKDFLQRQKEYESMSKLREELKKELECSICFDTFENPYMIPECCHRFCKHCIEESLARSGKQCPLCRCNVTSKRVLRKDELIGRISEVLICSDQSEGVV